MSRWPTLILMVVNLLVCVLLSFPAWAQTAGVETIVGPAAGKIVQQGLLGVLVTIEGVVIWYLYRQVQMANAKFLEMAVKQTEIFAEATRTLKRNEELIEKVLDVVRG